MIEALFNQPGYLAAKKTLDAVALRQEAVANNIANLETPGYKRVDLAPAFQTELERACASGDARQIASLNPTLAPRSERGCQQSDGNSVHLENELMQLKSKQHDPRAGNRAGQQHAVADAAGHHGKILDPYDSNPAGIQTPRRAPGRADAAQCDSENIANANTPTVVDGKPYQRQVVVFATALQQAMNADGSTATPALKVASIEKDTRDPVQIYDPGNFPDADARGMISMPNINIHEEWRT